MGGWIKWEKDIEADPRVLRMARELKRICNAGALHPVTLVCGGLVRLWSYADSHAREDDTLDLGASEIDDLIGIPGFCSIMPADWLREIDEHTVELPHFQAHNGTEARKKALTQKRVAHHRKRSSVTPALSTALPDQDLDQTKTSKKVPSEPMPRASFDAATVDGLDLAAWDAWIAYRIAIRKPLKTPSLAAAAKAMAKLGPSQAAAVENSIANQYQGLVEPKGANVTRIPRLTKYEQNRQGMYDDVPPGEADNFLLTGTKP